MRLELLLAGMVFAVAAPAAAHPRNHVFTSPADYVGRRVMICGYMIDGSNILESRPGREIYQSGGLSIRDGGPLHLRFRGRVCVEGEISYLGCETSGECTDAAFDYAISISRVLSAEPGPDESE